MKLNKYIFTFVAGVSMTLGFTACNSDSDFLEEHSYKYDDKGFYNTQEEIEEAVNPCYRQVQYLMQGQTHGGHSWMLQGINLDQFAHSSGNSTFSNSKLMTPSDGYIRHWYNELYYLVNYANTAIDAIDEKTNVKYNTATKKNELRAEAVFMQAWAYRCLAGMYGNVPILKKHTTEITLGYEPATRQEVWEYCYEQFKWAEENLPKTPRMIGSVTKAAAGHHLAEICLALGKFQEAKDAADRVISGADGDYHLMTERFGNRKNEATDRYGNSLAAPAGAYWDLFREGTGNNDANQDCADNKEAIWVSQYKYGSYAQGGGGDSWWRVYANTTEANWSCNAIRYNTANRTDAKGEKFYVWTDDAACLPTGVKGAATQHGVTKGTENRWIPAAQRDSIGAGYAYVGNLLIPTRYTQYGLWKGCGKDIRGSETMIQRNWYGPGGVRRYTMFKAMMDRQKANPDDQAYVITGADTTTVFARFWKFSDDKHPNGDTKAYDCEWYMIRIAETYLLKAEAQLGLGDKAGAAATINVLRDRAGGDHVSAADINIDFILDERTRELYGEEHRQITLNRLSCNPNATYVKDLYPVQDTEKSNTLYERTKKYGFSYNNLTAAQNESYGRKWIESEKRWEPNIQPYNFQYPIPTAVIQSNTGFDYPQNPGY